jgi:hypothetical protein
MSLINDALKKARHAQQHNPPPLGVQQFKPAESERRSSNLLFLLPIVVVLLSAAGGVLIWIALQRGTASQTGMVVPERKLPALAPMAPAAPVPVPVPEPAAPKEIEAPAAVIPALTETNVPAATNRVQVPVVEPAPKPALPVLRGIYFNPSRPSAVLNRKTVFIGDRVSGFRVIAITRESVTITTDGQTNVLTLGE